MVNRKYPYQPKGQTSINFDLKTLALLRFLKKEKYITSISESIREMINFALPFFIHTYKLKTYITAKQIKRLSIQKPKKETIKKLTKLQHHSLTPETLKDLRKKFPNIKDYKFINEKSTKK